MYRGVKHHKKHTETFVYKVFMVVQKISNQAAYFRPLKFGILTSGGSEMIEELAAHILNVDADEKWDELDELLCDEFNIDLEDFEKLIKKLLPLCEAAKSPLTGIAYRGFADTKNGMWLENIKIE